MVSAEINQKSDSNCDDPVGANCQSLLLQHWHPELL
jgi:hypothetical protein